MAGRPNYYSARSAVGHTSASQIARSIFNTIDLTASNIVATGATLTTPGYAGEWWYQRGNYRQHDVHLQSAYQRDLHG